MKSWSSFSLGISHSEEHEILWMVDQVLIQPPKVSSRIPSSLAHQSRPTTSARCSSARPESWRPPPPDHHQTITITSYQNYHQYQQITSRLPLTVDYYQASTNTKRSPPKLPPQDHHPLWLPQALNRALQRQCTCVSYVRAEQ